MKPFNLQDALKGAKVVTGSGRSAEILAYIPESRSLNQRLVVRLEGSENLMFYSDRGISTLDAAYAGDQLYMAVVKKRLWINVYQDGSVGSFRSQEDADDAVDHHDIREACVPIEYEVR